MMISRRYDLKCERDCPFRLTVIGAEAYVSLVTVDLGTNLRSRTRSIHGDGFFGFLLLDLQHGYGTYVERACDLGGFAAA